MNATVFDTCKGVLQTPVGEFLQHLPTDCFFWLDIEGASVEEMQAVATALHISEPTLSWLPRFGQRSRLEAGRQQTRISTWGVGASGLPTEVHILFTPSWILSVHEGVAGSMDKARSAYKSFAPMIGTRHFLGLLIILTVLMESFDPVLERLDKSLYELEEQIIQAPKGAQIEQLMRLRKNLWELHRLWEPLELAAKDLSAAVESGLTGISEHADQILDYAERIADLVDRIGDLRQRATEAMESYGTSVSNKQSQVINRLTIISAVFLPLTFLTGFFGMNFQWMIDRQKSMESFFLLGIGLFLVNLSATLLLFRRKGWLGERNSKKPMGRTAGAVEGAATDDHSEAGGDRATKT
jgi:Mg2+ and Co2+ transporter CorA